jgi:hypothetical protein
MKSTSGIKAKAFSLGVVVVGAVLFACGGNTSPSAQSRILQSAENDTDKQSVEKDTYKPDDKDNALVRELDDAVRFFEDYPPGEPFDRYIPDDIDESTSDCGDEAFEDGNSNFLLACQALEAQARRELNALLEEVSRLETDATVRRDAAQTAYDISVRMRNEIIPGLEADVNRARDARRIRAEQRIQFLEDLAFASRTLVTASSRFNAARHLFNNARGNAAVSRQLIQQGLDALNRNPPDVRTAAARGLAATNSFNTAVESYNRALRESRHGIDRAVEANARTDLVVTGLRLRPR